MMLNGGALDGARVLAPETVALMGQNHIGALNVQVMRSVVPAMSNDFEAFPGLDKKWGLSFLINTRDVPGGRAAGLFAWIAVVVVGGTFLAGLAATAIAPPSEAARIARSTGPALAYALAFSATIAPVALATLGARSRAGGYVGLLLVVFIPELLESITSTCVPDAWRDLTSIPAALTALRRALTPAIDSAIDGPQALRACAVLGAIIVVALVVLRQQVARVDAELARFP